MAARGDDSITAITIEDLTEALERGDITADEYDALYELVYSRAVADSAELARAATVLTPLAPQSVAPVRHSSTPAFGYLQYSYFSPLRGSGSPRQYITARPEAGAVGVDVRLSRRFRGLWTVEEVAAHYTNRKLSMTAGVLAPRWTGGLLIGRAPVFLDHSGEGWRGLWLPDQARLYGVFGMLKHRFGDVAVLHSSLSDSIYTHTVRGVRTRIQFGRMSIEPALVFQRLRANGGDAEFAGRFWGFAGVWKGPSLSLELDLATNEQTIAVQARAYGQSDRSRWWLEYWHIPRAYRNPLLQARGESDREVVYYPELDVALSSASTGERGGRLDVRLGGTASYVRLHMAAWRESEFRQASLRARVTARRALPLVAIQADYLLYSRVTGGLQGQRHEARIRISRRRVFASGRIRLTDEEMSAFGPLGGQLAGGIGFPLSHVGVWSVTLAAESYDLRTQAKQFVTVRVAQQLPFRHGRMDLNLRWRSTYASQPSALSLRVDSRVYL